MKKKVWIFISLLILTGCYSVNNSDESVPSIVEETPTLTQETELPTATLNVNPTVDPDYKLPEGVPLIYRGFNESTSMFNFLPPTEIVLFENGDDICMSADHGGVFTTNNQPEDSGCFGYYYGKLVEIDENVYAASGNFYFAHENVNEESSEYIPIEDIEYNSSLKNSVKDGVDFYVILIEKRLFVSFEEYNKEIKEEILLRYGSSDYYKFRGIKNY